MADYDEVVADTQPQALDPNVGKDVVSYDGIMANATQEDADTGPMYRMIGSNRIPVSKARGKLWKSRKDQSSAAMQKHRRAWDESLRYYRHDHTREVQPEDARNDRGGKSYNDGFDETENIVFANVAALVPMLYTKNPNCEFTVEDESDKPLSDLTEKLVNTLATKKMAPGINLKRKAKRNIVATTLFNIGWFDCGWVHREQSSDAALQELAKLTEELQNAKDEKVIREVEGKLMALELTIDMLQPSGPWVKVRRATDVFIDPTATELDLSDANWVAVRDYIPTSLLRAQYGYKDIDSSDETYKSVFEPTHVLKVGNDKSGDGDVSPHDNFQLFNKAEDEHSKYGYGDQRSYKSAQMTEVFYIWDKVTRRCELYSAADWCYPVWVWNDPYMLDQFYPLVPMEFHTDPSALYAKGEVTYYLDQQDALNQVNNEFSKIRQFASGKIMYDINSIKDLSLIEGIISGTSDTRSLGVDLKEDKKLNEVVAALLPPSADAIKFFDKKPILEAIDRISGVASVQRGVEYKTNTTNRAIESYESQMQTRADEKMDAIEESIGTVLWLIAQMCLQFMPQQQVAGILGDKHASGWVNLSPEEIRAKFSPRVVGGSSLKPSSRAKKEQAMQIVQILGQFAGASPIAVAIALKVLSRAFDDVIISLEEWEMIYKSLVTQLQGGAAGGDAEPPPTSEGAGGGSSSPPSNAGASQRGSQQPSQGGGESSGGGGMQQIEGIAGVVQEVARLIDSLPQEIKQFIGLGLARGQQVEEIAAEAIAQMQQGATR